MEKCKNKLSQNSKLLNFMTHFDELVTFSKPVSDVQYLCGCILPDIKAGPNNCRYVKGPYDHACKYHFIPNDRSLSSPGPLAVKHTLSKDPTFTTFTKKAINTIISVRGQAL